MRGGAPRRKFGYFCALKRSDQRDFLSRTTYLAPQETCSWSCTARDTLQTFTVSLTARAQVIPCPHYAYAAPISHCPCPPAAAARHAAPRVPARSGGAAALSSSAGSTEHTPSQREARTAQLARVDDRPDPKRMRHCLTLTVSRSLSHEALSLMVKGMQGETGQHTARPT